MIYKKRETKKWKRCGNTILKVIYTSCFASPMLKLLAPPHPLRFLLPEYVLDFGFVIPGQVVTRDVRITNTGPMSVSFSGNHKPLVGTGKVHTPALQQQSKQTQLTQTHL